MSINIRIKQKVLIDLESVIRVVTEIKILLIKADYNMKAEDHQKYHL